MYLYKHRGLPCSIYVSNLVDIHFFWMMTMPSKSRLHQQSKNIFIKVSTVSKVYPVVSFLWHGWGVLYTKCLLKYESTLWSCIRWKQNVNTNQRGENKWGWRKRLAVWWSSEDQDRKREWFSGSWRLSLSPSLGTDVFLRLIFPLRVYSSVLSPPSPGDFMPPEQPERPFFLQPWCPTGPRFKKMILMNLAYGTECKAGPNLGWLFMHAPHHS